jgi:hypothetical protein
VRHRAPWFAVRIQRGGAKTYILKCRAGTGRDTPLRKLSIGKHGSPWTPDEARAETERLSRLVARGRTRLAVEDNPHIIVGGVKGGALVSLEKPWRAIRKAAGLEDVRLRDLAARLRFRRRGAWHGLAAHRRDARA